jgi:hypothetical protein
MKLTLNSPDKIHGWNIHLIEFSLSKEFYIHEILYHANWYKINPIVQGSTDNWIMIEFCNDSESYILECCLQIAKVLKVELIIK